MEEIIDEGTLEKAGAPSRGQKKYSLEKEMATHSRNPAWEISWTEEPGELQSRGLQKSQTQLSN